MTYRMIILLLLGADVKLDSFVYIKVVLCTIENDMLFLKSDVASFVEIVMNHTILRGFKT